MTDSVVVEGYARLRDGKKWKTRWLVLRKPSPVADCLVLLVFKDKSDKAQGNRERASVTLEEICGLESGQWLEGVAFTLTVLCLNQTALLGFDTREALQAWDARIRYSLGEVHRFNVGVLPGTKLESGPASLHLCNSLLALARDTPPVIVGHWNLPDLRRYGPVPNGFVFEGGTRCGYWAGVFLLASAESEQISFLFDCIVRGISPTRGPFGLRPVLPDLSPNQTNSEEKLNHEAQELEKRLSMLSHRSSTVSSAGGDDHSISGSSDTSDTSQSDCSVGSRLVIWSDPASNPPENMLQLGAKVPPPAAEKLLANQGVGARPAAKAPRQLQEIGRQSSSDSGIATGSHSSYSGSFSSYTGSLDIAPAEEFGSVFSLPPHLAQDLSPCSCPAVPGHEYQVPTSLRYLYDTPRSLLQEEGVGAKDSDPPTPTTDAPDPSTPPAEAAKGDKSSASAPEGHSDGAHRHSVSEQSEDARKTKTAPSSDSQHPESCHICSSLTSASKTIVTICSVCGGYKGAAYVPAVPDRSGKCRSVSGLEFSNTAGKSPEVRDCRGSGSGSERPKTSEDPLPPKTGRDKLAGLLAELLGLTSPDPKPKPSSLTLYEPMSPVFGNELKTYRMSDRSDAIYENCVKCRGDRCQPPPRVPNLHVGNAAALQPSETGSNLNAGAHEDLVCQGPSGGSQSEDGSSQNQEANGEDKKFSSREDRCRADPAYEIMERTLEADDKPKYELMGGCGQQRFLQDAEGPVFVFPPEAAASERPRADVTYVNIPVSPTSKKQLNYMELELQEPGPSPRGPVPHLPTQRKSSTKYAQIDITATETAHKVGTQHALGRQEGLHTLELRRKATPH